MPSKQAVDGLGGWVRPGFTRFQPSRGPHWGEIAFRWPPLFPDMTRVCLVGDDDLELRYELLSRETSREALSTYDLRAPFANTVGAETVSLGAAVSLLNDLNWYIIRFVTDALVLEPSIDDEEWLSRELATAIRAEGVRPDETGRLLKVYGIERPADDTSAPSDRPAESGDDDANEAPLPRLVEPMFMRRTDDGIPTYDIRDVDDTLVVRVTEREFEAG